MKTPVQELFEYMEQNQYFIGNDLLAKYNEVIEKEVANLLPTDEAIIKQGKAKYPYKKTSDGTYYEGKCKGYIEGAMWLKDKIKQL